MENNKIIKNSQAGSLQDEQMLMNRLDGVWFARAMMRLEGKNDVDGRTWKFDVKRFSFSGTCSSSFRDVEGGLLHHWTI